MDQGRAPDDPGHDEPGHECQHEHHEIVVKMPTALWTLVTTGAAVRHFRLELGLAATYLGTQIILAMATDNWWLIGLAAVTITGLLLAIAVRSITSHRIGFSMGIEAFPLAAFNRDRERAEKILRGSYELWSPPPTFVAHQLDIDDLEKHANRDGEGDHRP